MQCSKSRASTPRPRREEKCSEILYVCSVIRAYIVLRVCETVSQVSFSKSILPILITLLSRLFGHWTAKKNHFLFFSTKCTGENVGIFRTWLPRKGRWQLTMTPFTSPVSPRPCQWRRGRTLWREGCYLFLPQAFCLSQGRGLML